MASEEILSKIVTCSCNDLEAAEVEVRDWFDDVVSGVQRKCKDADEETIDAEMLKKVNKEVLCEWLEEAWNMFERFRITSVKARKTLNNVKGQLITCQSQVIELQQNLLEKRSADLEAVTSAVTTSVKESVKTECRGYAEAVKKTSYNPVFSPETLTKVVKEVVKEEDRSRNVIVFGLDEDKDENLSEKIGGLLGTIGQKPRTEVCRIGKSSAERIFPRPVKVTLSSSNSVKQVLQSAKELKTCPRYKRVFLSPDRSLSERELHKNLVSELKKKISDDPETRHYIRNATVYSVRKVD